MRSLGGSPLRNRLARAGICVGVGIGAMIIAFACNSPVAETGPVNVCKNQVDGADCDGGGLCCGQMCMTFLTDPNNCGICGFACPNQQPCSNGVCLECSTPGIDGGFMLAEGTACNAGSYEGLCCDGVCVDTRSDPGNCGGCGDDYDAGPPTVCSIGDLCVDAGCVSQCVGAANNSACSIEDPQRRHLLRPGAHQSPDRQQQLLQLRHGVRQRADLHPGHLRGASLQHHRWTSAAGGLQPPGPSRVAESTPP